MLFVDVVHRILLAVLSYYRAPAAIAMASTVRRTDIAAEAFWLGVTTGPPPSGGSELPNLSQALLLEQLSEFGSLAQPSKFLVRHQLFAVVEALAYGHAEILQCAFIHSHLGISFCQRIIHHR